MDQKEANIPDRKPVAQRGPPQRQLVDNTNLPPVANQPVIDDPIPVRHFEPNPLLEVPQPDKDHKKRPDSILSVVQEIPMSYKIHLILKWKFLLQTILLNQSSRDQK